ncbi:hypothetical protein NPX79_01515 [Spiroplasma endosymbiont of Anurida maritima]|uniref:hypothetical protein n=1 Tax=Spiroplasma endosymbiont of Anurida maritima TaxID=2967972 RepID=UPI0036D2C96E
MVDQELIQNEVKEDNSIENGYEQNHLQNEQFEDEVLSEPKDILFNDVKTIENNIDETVESNFFPVDNQEASLSEINKISATNEEHVEGKLSKKRTKKIKKRTKSYRANVKKTRKIR